MSRRRRQAQAGFACSDDLDRRVPDLAHASFLDITRLVRSNKIRRWSFTSRPATRNTPLEAAAACRPHPPAHACTMGASSPALATFLIPRPGYARGRRRAAVAGRRRAPAPPPAAPTRRPGARPARGPVWCQWLCTKTALRHEAAGCGCRRYPLHHRRNMVAAVPALVREGSFCAKPVSIFHTRLRVGTTPTVHRVYGRPALPPSPAHRGTRI